VKKICSVLAISGRTAQIKDELTVLGFRYNAVRKSWAKFANPEEIETLRDQGKALALKHLGNILVDVFLSEKNSWSGLIENVVVEEETLSTKG
jgi:hypothetical protein